MKRTSAALLALLSLLTAPALCAAQALDTPVTDAAIDTSVYAEWTDGAEKPLRPADDKDKGSTPQWVLWRPNAAPGHSGFAFGASKTPGPRHLRMGFKTPVTVGAVLVRGGGRVSVLRPDAAYPGDMTDESQWIAAQHIQDRQVGDKEAGRESYALWVLPERVTTRALRFTHVAEPTERDYAGWVGGVYVLPERVANVAPQALAIGSANDKYIAKIVNLGTDGGWGAWENIPREGGERAQVVSAQSPEWVMLVWPAPVRLRGLGALWAGFGAADAQAYTGPGDVHPREAPESAWKTIKSFAGLKNRYPSSMGVDWLDFGEEVTTRAIRLRMTGSIDDTHHPHVRGHARDGKRVWLGELLALQPLGRADLKTALLPLDERKEQPPIPVRFTLPEPGWVTLVIEDASGKRVRNLVADTYFEAGQNTVWWDGSDDLGRDTAAPKHGVYYIPTQLVAPGSYRVRGLWRKQVDVKYEMALYNAGNPPWETADTSGGWLANHTPPSAALFVPDAGKGEPAILIGSYVSEGGAGLAWLDTEGRKRRGQNWVGGTWTGAPYLTRDTGPNALPDVYAYAGAAWSAETNPQTAKTPRGEIRLTALTAGADRPVLKYTFTPPVKVEGAPAGDAKWEAQIGGLAAHNGLLAVSLTELNQLLFVDARAGKAFGVATLESPRGLAFDAQGRLLALSGSRLVRLRLPENHAFEGSETLTLPAPEVVVASLDEPRGLTVDAKGAIYVSERGTRHQVRSFSADGKPQRTFGKPGVPKAGPYDPLRMTNPRGLTVDAGGRLWVAEEDFQPKRVSVWNPDGTLGKEFYGPADYGGGGTLDPTDRTRYYYRGMEFRLDWTKGTTQLASVLYRRKPEDIKLGFRSGTPEAPIYRQGRRYFTNSYNSNPTGGQGTAFIFQDRNGIAAPIAAAGRATEWDVLKGDAFKSLWPADTDPDAHPSTAKAAFFVWSDKNGDTQAQPDEVVFRKARNGGVTVASDLSFVVARLEERAVRLAPASFTAQGVPLYDPAAAQTLVEGVNAPPSSGGDQALLGPDGWTIHTTAPKPFSGHGFGGAKNGVAMWSYPSLWPGLHASHEAPVPDRPGMVIGHTRLLGDFIRPRGSEPMWAINGNHGPVYVFTADGLFVTQIFQDMRVGRRWGMPVAERGMLLNEMTPSDENFWPSVTQTADGGIYLVTGRPNSLVRVEGLESVRRIPEFSLNVTAEDLGRARDYYARAEAARQAAQGRGVLRVELRTQTPAVDGKLDDWAGAEWVDIDKRGTAAYFNSSSKPYNVTGTATVAGDRLYAAWRTGDTSLLQNSGAVPNALFKTGGALDLMIGADPAASPKRAKPVQGDQRLLITRVDGKTRALLYRAVVPGTKEPIPFTSPVSTVTFDRVEDVSDQVQLAGVDGDYEVSVPLTLLGLKPEAGQSIQGDIGILRGSGGATTQRVYWTNKATAIVADVPSEAELRPNLWGRWEFTAGK